METRHSTNKKIAQAQNDRFLGKISEEEAARIIAENALSAQRPETPYPLNWAQTEVPYTLWKSVKHWAEENGYRFNYAGDPGSLRHANDSRKTHTQDEPVTYLSWYDAVVWCNALSELLGRKPVYYADPEFKQVYRNALEFRLDTFADEGNPVLPWATKMEKGARVHTGSADRIFFSSQADGYRLPLDIEFTLANDSGETKTIAEREWVAPHANDKTQPAGSRKANPKGLFDMNGNVFEWAWDSENAYYEMQNSAYRLNGNGYFYESYEKTKPRSEKKVSAYSDFTANAKPFVGFRIVGKP